MKKIIYSVSIFLTLLGLNSCQDWLDADSKSVFTEESTFSNVDFASKAVFGIYQTFTTGDSYGYYYPFTKIDSDIEFTFSANEGAKNQLAHYAGTPGSKKLEEMWNALYFAIERANLCIDNLPLSPIWEGADSKEAHRLYGEAVTLRALAYYELIHTWGDVPFSIKSTQAGDDYNLPKTDRDEIYEYLIEDLKNVEQYVPWLSETRTVERVNKGFVKGLRARMAMAYAGYSLRNGTLETKRGAKSGEYYEIARQESKELIESGQHQLNPDFENIFRTIHTYSMDLTYGEILFEIALGRTDASIFASRVGMAFWSGDTKYGGGGGGSVSVPPTYYYSFDRNDKRRDVSVGLYNYADSKYPSQQRLISNNGRAFTPNKWRKSWMNPLMGGDLASNRNSGLNFPIMRYTDVVLIFAEAENEINGPTKDAKEALAMVRKRAFPQELWDEKVDAYIESISSDKESFFNAIVDERAWEFGGGELVRKNDLIRWNLLGSKINEMREECMKLVNDDASYATIVPDYIFWRHIDEEQIEILNPDYRLPATSIEGYTRSAWLPLMSSSNKRRLQEDLAIVANGLDVQKNNYLYPIANNIITASNGVLTNDQIPQ
ncbi:RagB/SusD family nutrient uptake outer membrane protein [Proteiniphilum sp. UBA1028]|jgi:hypothetical protein|uniref:RagB/SusD family nutrient uptake outer membrane protein n=1 Tax=Proteiniphilum sp. UBA1028 TaxID=1947251 RepID=UPI000E94B3DB|nr:RagB/SusD family nutrient uptake outer membrane protein [Proteiniphilum sp. UBA1028]HBG57538.1 RagB/SusD family nutrient uptake outer membrane protein [Porphyromonadaceae bacterium]